MKIDFAKELNTNQYEAVSYIDGASLVIAGAGSGKTRVLTYKVAYLLENGYYPSEILALTFTNKAAREMKERIANMLGKSRVRYLQMGTFHSVFLRILREEHERIGFDKNFTIYDTSDSVSLIRSIIKEQGLDDKKYKPNNVFSKISRIKNYLITHSMYANNPEVMKADRKMNMDHFHVVYSEYSRRCKCAMAMDFDDILLHTYNLFVDNKDVLDKYKERFRFILVDEYQDTNHAQHSLIRLLAQDHKRICVVGDDAQSIYSFRGANIGNIINFQETYQTTKLFKLEQNYRSTQSIVKVANSLISRNMNQIRKNVFSEREIGDRVVINKLYNDLEEAIYVTRRIETLKRMELQNYSDIAILYRTNSQSRLFEEELRKCNIPYRIYGGLSFYQRKEIKDVVSYFRLVVNPNDEEALRRIINYPTRGIGDTTIKKILACAISNSVSMWEVIKDPLAYNLEVNKGTLSKLKSFYELIDSMIEFNKDNDALQTSRFIIEKSNIIAEILGEKTEEEMNRYENVLELINGISSFCDMRKEEGVDGYMLSDFLYEVSLITDNEEEDSDNTDRVTLMTIHSSKGLEFKNVFIVGLEEGLFPSERSTDSIKDIEEERRLLYVAITRAEEKCFISFALMRMRFGKIDSSSPSRFLCDIDRSLLDANFDLSTLRFYNDGLRNIYSNNNDVSNRVNMIAHQQPKTLNSLVNSIPKIDNNVSEEEFKPICDINSGDRVEHNRFGFGVVESVEGSENDMRAVVKFKEHGTKTLLLRFAKLKKI